MWSYRLIADAQDNELIEDGVECVVAGVAEGAGVGASAQRRSGARLNCSVRKCAIELE